MNIYCEFENLKENLNKNEKFLIKKRKEKHNTTITNIEIKCKKLAKAINKDVGKYTTIYCEKFDYLSNSHFDFLVDNLKEEILKLINSFSFKTKNLKYFIVGLGNNKITADSLGYLVTEKILSTTKDIENKKLSKKTFGNAFSIAPSIASKNGIYTSQIILSLCKELKPDIVILVDSLSCKNINFLGKTFQINTCGLTPGCEVGNKQPKICKSTLKTPVLAIGCPVVSNLSNIVKTSKFDPVLTLKDIDIAIKKYADIISFTLNQIIHKNLNKNEIIFLTKE